MSTTSPARRRSPSTRRRRSSARTRRPRSRSCSSTGCGCCRVAGSVGRRSSRRPATSPSRPAGRTTRRRSPRRRSIPRCSPTRASARSPTTSTGSSAGSTGSPPSIGHSFGGLLTEILAGRGRRRRVGRDQPRAVPRRPAAADLRAALGGAGAQEPRELQPRRPAHVRAVPLRLRERRLRGRGEVPLRRRTRSRAPAVPLFQAATANLNPWTEVKVDTKNPSAGRC